VAVVHPELVTGREDGFAIAPWTVTPGSTARGQASCNLTDRILEVPLGRDATSRVVRVHELMHARVSPHLGLPEASIEDVAVRALECAEELRINTLVARLGFDVALLRDGSERNGAMRLAEADDWSEALCFLMAVLGTGAEKEYLAGIRKVRPSWLAALRAVRKRALAMMVGFTTTSLGATRLNGEQVPSGYFDATVTLARILTSAMSARVPCTPEELRQFRRSLEPGGRRAPSGRFAPLRFDETIAMSARPRSAGVRRSRPHPAGVVMRYPSRLLTDELRRAFAQRVSVHGGIVIIDQSGSMDIEEEQLRSLLRTAPDALVVGYSHRPGDRGQVPNVWILANRGAVASSFPTGNVGNGVDGPVLEWALARRRGNEPVVWVTDGQITDSHDHPDGPLTEECARLVRVARVRLVRNLDQAGGALRRIEPTKRSSWKEFGRLGRILVGHTG